MYNLHCLIWHSGKASSLTLHWLGKCSCLLSGQLWANVLVSLQSPAVRIVLAKSAFEIMGELLEMKPVVQCICPSWDLQAIPRNMLKFTEET